MSIEEHQIIGRWERVKKLAGEANLEIDNNEGFTVSSEKAQLRKFIELSDLEVFVSGYCFGFKSK